MFPDQHRQCDDHSGMISDELPACDHRIAIDGETATCVCPRLIPLGEKQVSLELCRKCVFSLAPPESVPVLLPPNPRGPGTHLKLLLSRLKIDAEHKGCQCKNHAAKMDRKGTAWCRENMNTILGWLKTEAKRRKIPFSKVGAKTVVLLAIRRAEREEAECK